jgi:hypothetical protein
MGWALGVLRPGCRLPLVHGARRVRDRAHDQPRLRLGLARCAELAAIAASSPAGSLIAVTLRILLGHGWMQDGVDPMPPNCRHNKCPEKINDAPLRPTERTSMRRVATLLTGQKRSF